MHVVALLDKPSTESFGMVAFVVRDDDGRLLTAGFANPDYYPVVEPEYLDFLVRSNQARDVSAAGVRLTPPLQGLVAGWLGGGFARKVIETGSPAHTAPEGRHLVEEGSFWIAKSADVFKCLSDWIDAAAERVFVEKNKALARLMCWTLPNRIESAAAAWWTQPTDEGKERELEWQQRTRFKKADRRQVLAEFEAVAHKYLQRSS